MKDWGWEARESGNMLGLFLHLEADFSAGSEHHQWFKALKLKHYSLYEGPFHYTAPAYREIVCAWLEKPFYRELRAAYQEGSSISYASYFHEVLLMPSLMVFQRAWGYGGTEASDTALLTALLERGIELGEWFIQDLDFGNEWVRDRGTASFRAYLGLPAKASNKTFAELFTVSPEHWDLRGDPVLWLALAAAAESQPWPASATQLSEAFSQSFTTLTGYPLSHAETVYLPAYDQGGLSGGQVSPVYWRETVLPMLLERYQALRGR